jgi:hypothetical protein
MARKTTTTKVKKLRAPSRFRSREVSRVLHAIAISKQTVRRVEVDPNTGRIIIVMPDEPAPEQPEELKELL